MFVTDFKQIIFVFTLVFSQIFLFILLFNISFDSVLCESDSNQDYYQLLGVGKDADNRDIRKAFKKLALTKHPDKNTVSLRSKSESFEVNLRFGKIKVLFLFTILFNT